MHLDGHQPHCNSCFHHHAGRENGTFKSFLQKWHNFWSHVTVHSESPAMPTFQGGKKGIMLEVPWREERQDTGGRIYVYTPPCVIILWWGQGTLGLINFRKLVFTEAPSLLHAYLCWLSILDRAMMQLRWLHNVSRSLVKYRADLWQACMTDRGWSVA